MSLSTKLKDIFKAIAEELSARHGPFDPAPAVKEKMESWGYKYTFATAAGAGFAVSGYNVTTPSGEPVGWNREAYEQYHKDYNTAVAACKRENPSFDPRR